MSTDRDTHFSGFANLLYADLVKLFTALLSCRVLGQDDNAAYTEQAIKEVIAQRAYDLVCHVLESEALQNEFLACVDGNSDLEKNTDLLREIPDLTE